MIGRSVQDRGRDSPYYCRAANDSSHLPDDWSMNIADYKAAHKSLIVSSFQADVLLLVTLSAISAAINQQQDGMP